MRRAPTAVPLAGPANRQGRIAADSILGRDMPFRGVQGTAVCGAFGLTMACTGSNLRALAQSGGFGQRIDQILQQLFGFGIAQHALCSNRLRASQHKGESGQEVGK